MKKTYYEILGIPQTATQEEIKKAFRTLAKKYHPDNYTSNQAAANLIMQDLTEAYVVLSDLQKRIEYDRKLEKIHREQTRTEYRTENSFSKNQSKSHYESYTKTTPENESDLEEWIKEFLHKHREKINNNFISELDKYKFYKREIQKIYNNTSDSINKDTYIDIEKTYSENIKKIVN